ncbi:rhodanese-like domain-containing protein [Phormidium tenue FACHB-886]|nr:rhodanese-like domain-containing protein [Phormidium tenue FACHB-886]
MLLNNLQQRLRTIAWMLAKQWIHRQFPTVPSLSTRELAAWLEQEGIGKPLLLDVRSNAEFEVSHLRHARLANRLEAVQSIDSASPIVLYCSIGYRSARLAQQLQAQGYSRVFNLEGSIFQWVNEGRSVYRGEQAVRQVHPYNWQWGLLLNDPHLRQNLDQATHSAP